MIFVTIGTQGPFDRLIEAVDQWAGAQEGREVFAQIGPTSYAPKHMKWVRTMEPLEFRKAVEQADVVVSHAGMGTIITALEMGKPILVMPRRASFREMRNDHQVDTARHFLAQGRIEVAFDETELPRKLEQLDRMTASAAVPSEASPQLLQTLRRFADQGVVSCAAMSFDGVVMLCTAHTPAPRGLVSEGLAALRVIMEVEQGEQSKPLANLLPTRAPFRRPQANVGVAELGPMRVSASPWHCRRGATQIRRACAKLGMRLPLLWASVPSAAPLVQHVPHAGLIYHRPNQALKERELAEDGWLKARADVTLFDSYAAYQAESGACNRPVLWANGHTPERSGLAEALPNVWRILQGARPDRVDRDDDMPGPTPMPANLPRPLAAGVR